MGMATATLMILFLINVYTSLYSTEDKLGIMAVSMLMLACYSALYSLIKSPLARLILLIVGLILAIKAMQVTTSQATKKTIDQNAELIVKPHSSQVAAFKSYCHTKGYKIELCFTPIYGNQTALDEYFTLDIANGFNLENVKAELNNTGFINEIYSNVLYKNKTFEGIAPAVNKKANLTNDPLRSQQWNLDIIDHDGMLIYIKQKRIKPKKKASLWIADSGIDASHEDISGIYKSHELRSDTDIKGHGTHCGGIAAAVNNNKLGISAVIPSSDWARVTSIKVMNEMGFGSRRDILEGMITAVDEGADVISMSLGGLSLFGSRELYDEAVDYASLRGAIVVVAAGNSNSDADQYTPANSRGSITVTAIDENNNKAEFSNTVSNIRYAVAAPGTNILSLAPGNKYISQNGTSMATPHVAGLITILKSIDPNLTVEQAYTILNDTGRPTNQTQLTGRLVNAKAAIERITR